MQLRGWGEICVKVTAEMGGPFSTAIGSKRAQQHGGMMRLVAIRAGWLAPQEFTGSCRPAPMPRRSRGLRRPLTPAGLILSSVLLSACAGSVAAPTLVAAPSAGFPASRVGIGGVSATAKPGLVMTKRTSIEFHTASRPSSRRITRGASPAREPRPFPTPSTSSSSSPNTTRATPLPAS